MCVPVLVRAVAEVRGRPVAEPLPAEQIMEQGLSEADADCSRSLDAFCSLLGGFAGNVALILGARGGVYIGGGIAPKNLRFMQSESFIESFRAKGRMRPLLEAIPVRILLNQRTALLGAARRATESLGQGSGRVTR